MLLLSALICVDLRLITSCSLKPTDLRALAPAESLVYLETNDLAAALQPIVDSKPFNEVAKYKPDLSALKGVQLAVAVTGFETSEEKVTDENSIGRIQPHFVAIADMHAWNFQAVKFAEQKLGAFVEKIYESQPTLEKSDKNGGKYFVWTAADGRKAYALVIDGLIYFGNDESSIEKCLATRRGESDSLIKTGKVQPADPAILARGYVSTDGIAQIANIIGLKLAAEASDESEVQSTTASIVPQVLRNTISDITWNSYLRADRIHDDVSATVKHDVAQDFERNIAMPADDSAFQSVDFEDYIPSDAASITRYVVRDPLSAWRTILLTATQAADEQYRPYMVSLSDSVFDSYGIENRDLFLKSIVDRRILTALLDQDGDEVVVITKTRDLDSLKRSLSKQIDFTRPADSIGDVLIWKSTEDGLAMAGLKVKILTDDPDFIDEVIIGNLPNVMKCLNAKATGNDFTRRERYKEFEITYAAALTISNEEDSGSTVVDVLAERKSPNQRFRQRTFTQTWLDERGISRSTMSDTGFIGWIIAQLNEE